MSIKIIPEPDVYVTQEEIERLRQEYAKAMSYYSGPVPSFETWVKQRKRQADDIPGSR